MHADRVRACLLAGDCNDCSGCNGECDGLHRHSPGRSSPMRVAATASAITTAPAQATAQAQAQAQAVATGAAAAPAGIVSDPAPTSSPAVLRQHLLRLTSPDPLE